MTIQRLIRRFFSYFLFFNIFKKYKNNVSLLKIKAARAYVIGVKKTRVFFFGALLVLVAFVFLINSLFLVQAAMFTYSMWSREMKFIAALVLAGIELLAAIGILSYLFREETWGKFFGIHKVIDLVVNKKDHNNKNLKEQS
ncbi:MAG: hypothetical protein HQL25_00315 [Candidatus Omnitrophica bacterium]|nr:hypothetical protein [Candidatus Omnitrophota bacterium]